MQMFVGSGNSSRLGRELAPWVNAKGEQVLDERRVDHPAGYSADAGLVEAVNTALILGKPLLLTGRPGTGKSELAERIAWELGLGGVLRFEAQSLTEAQELFYRFDLVGQMADAQMATSYKRAPQPPGAFLIFGPLGKAILYASDPAEYAELRGWDTRSDLRWQDGAQSLATEGVDMATASMPLSSAAPAATESGQARRSVVLIDEIDKAARDVPNDLLNGIDRMEFRIRELGNRLVKAPQSAQLRPVVVITSNSERDLPEPFMRRCVFYHIPDPDQEKLREIMRARVFGQLPGEPGAGEGSVSVLAGSGQLAPFYEALLSFYVAYRDVPPRPLAYRPGTSELLDWARALHHRGAQAQADLGANRALLAATLSAVLKHRDDKPTLLRALQNLKIDLSAA